MWNRMNNGAVGKQASLRSALVGGFAGLVAVLLLVLALARIGSVASAQHTHVSERVLPDVAELQQRAELAARALAAAALDYEREAAPMMRVLLHYGAEEVLADRVALSLLREARRVGVEPRLLLAVLLVENPWIDTLARSPVGAVGLMQVMPFHRGNWHPCPPELEDVEANICHGARIFAHYLQAERGDVERALLRYNGCVRGTNTPDCHRYPYHVYARAGRASILAWLGQVSPVAATP